MKICMIRITILSSFVFVVLTASARVAAAQSFDLSTVEQSTQPSGQQFQLMENQPAEGARRSGQGEADVNSVGDGVASVNSAALHSMGARGDSDHNTAALHSMGATGDANHTNRPTTSQRINGLPPCTTAVLSRDRAGFGALQNLSPDQLLAIQQRYGSLMNYITGNQNPFGPMSLFNSGNSYSNPYSYGPGNFAPYFNYR